MRALILTLLLAITGLFPGTAWPQHDDWRARYIAIDAPALLLTNVRVVDGTGAPATGPQSILLEQGRIQAIGSDLAAPAGVRTLDLRGRTVMPGLVMLHEHMMYFSGRAVWHAQPVSYPKLYLAAGVTTLRTGGTEHPEVDRNLKARIDGGFAPGPKMHLTGPYFNGAAGDFLGDTLLGSPEDARAAVAYWTGRGFHSLKLYDAIEPDVAKALVDEAHRRGAKVSGHLGKTGCAEAADLGIDFIEHGFLSCVKDLGIAPDAKGYVAELDNPNVTALIRRLVDAKVVLVTTPADLERPLGEDAMAMLHPQARDNYRQTIHAPWLPDSAGLRELRKLERAFVQAGGRLGLGADAMDFGLVAGYANHRVLELLVEDGWSPGDVIRMATSGGADLLGVGDSVGRIAPGMAADLIVVDGNPLDDIRAIERIEWVIKDGAVYDPAKLREAAKGLVGWQ
jgi:imidazolonepropionase-like amidohydrolase